MKTRRLEVDNKDLDKSLIDDGEVDIGPEYWQDRHGKYPVIRYERDGYVASNLKYVYRVVEPPYSTKTDKGQESTAFWVAFDFWDHLCFIWMTRNKRRFFGTNLNTVVTVVSIILGIVTLMFV